MLVTGTHEETPEVVNTLYDASGVVREDRWQRLPGSYHGSGCTLASAIAATLANGLAIPEAVREAQDYTWQHARRGLPPRRRPVASRNRFFSSEAARPVRGHARHRGAGRSLRQGRAALAGGVALLQYRNKDPQDKRLLRSAGAARRSRARYGVPFIVNDDVELALAVGADGVHLGRDDGDLAAARAQAAGQASSASPATTDLELARAAVAAGADYVAFGSVFPSPTKPAAVRAPLSLFGARASACRCARSAASRCRMRRS